MKKRIFKNTFFKGSIKAREFNSDGKPIGFIAQTDEGKLVELNADHLLKKLKKSIGRQVSIIGDYCQISGVMSVKKIFGLEKTSIKA